ncbi:hypothetical protein EDD86DRAFT_181786, partial [Gorgonomyces haynaldii]
LTIPQQIEEIDGVEWLSFVYTSKGQSVTFKVRIDLEQVNMDELDEDFKAVNSVYPRANVDYSEYRGNRWDYETSVNDIGWKLCWLNQEMLSGKRGLLQRAVDSYRNRFPESQSRRVARVKQQGTPKDKKKRKKSVDIEVPVKIRKTSVDEEHRTRETAALEVRVDFESVDPNFTEAFKKDCAVYPDPKDKRERRCNAIGYLLRTLNPETLASPAMLQRAIDVYLYQF